MMVQNISQQIWQTFTAMLLDISSYQVPMSLDIFLGVVLPGTHMVTEHFLGTQIVTRHLLGTYFARHM